MKFSCLKHNLAFLGVETVSSSNNFCNSKVLAIRPSYRIRKGSGIAIFNETTGQLETCSLLASETQKYEKISSNNIANQIRQFWEQHMGHQQEPKTLCVQYPHQYSRVDSGIFRQRSIVMSGALCAQIEDRFRAQTILRPDQNSIFPDQNEDLPINRLDIESRNTLTRCLGNIPLHLRDNLLTAIALGIWAVETRTKNNIPSFLTDIHFGTRVFQKPAQPLFHAL